MAANRPLLVDGSVDFSGGQDSSKIPDRIAKNAYYAGVNVTTKNGALNPRLPFFRLDLGIQEGSVTLPNLYERSFEDIFRSGKFQGAAPYVVGPDFYIVMLVSGVIFFVNQVTNEVSVVEIEDGESLNEHADRLSISLAGRFLVIHDYPAYPVIIEGATARRANPLDLEVPISTIGTYNQNRLFVANAGNEFTAGDPAGSRVAPEAPITFLELFTIGSPFFGQIFQLPTSDPNYPITAMTFLQTADTATGIGPLLVSTEKAIYSFQTQNPRVLWEAGQFGSNFTYDVGIAGPKAFAHVRSDLFFLSSEGEVHSLSMSRDAQNTWSKIPISREVQNWLKYYDKNLIRFGVMTYFNNYLFVAANPYRVRVKDTQGNPITDYAHGGFVMLNMANISKLGSASAPVWDGLWTGVQPMDILVSNKRCFVISKDGGGVNEIWEVKTEPDFDRSGKFTRPITGKVYTREYDSGDPFQNKEPHSIDVALADLQGNVSLDIKYKPSHSSVFLPWRLFKHTAPYKICGIPNGKEVNGLVPHQLRVLNLGGPSSQDDCDPISSTFYRLYQKLQFLFVFRGKNWRMDAFKLKSVFVDQSDNEVLCSEFPPVPLIEECNDDWKVEEFTSCQTE